MKKKFSLAACILAIVLMFTGCQSAKKEVSYQKENLEQVAEFIVSNFSQMTDEQLDSFMNVSDFNLNYTLLNTGLDMDGDVFKSAIEAWKAAAKECGAYKDHGDYTLEEKSSGAVLKTETQFEDRDAVMEFEFDEHSRLSSLTVNAQYSKGEILEKAGLNTVLGMGTVFIVLIFMAFVISLIKYIPGLLEKMSGKKPAEEAVKETAPQITETAEEENLADDMELVAVISAAIAAAEGTSPDGFVVRSIKKHRKQNRW